MRTVDLPPLDLPAVSMRLDASAAAVGAANPKKPSIQRFQRAAASGGKPVAEATAAEKTAAASPTTAPIAPPGGLRLAARAAPVVPSPGTKAPAGPNSSTWQSIFDVGEDNVRRAKPTSKTGEKSKKPSA